MNLRPDQIADLAILMQNPKHLHLSEPGTGKTPTVCTYQRYLWDAHGTPSVWSMPKSLMEKNRDEALAWGGWPSEDVVIVDGTQSDCEAKLRKPAKVFLMGFRRFALEQHKFPAEWRAVQIDEFHKGYGGAESDQTGALFEFMERQGKFFTPMTGTLVNGTLETAFPAIQIIEPRYYGNFKAFRNYHRLVDPFTGEFLGYQHHDHLQKILRRHNIRRLFRDIFGDQEVVTQVEWLSMNRQQREMYDKFEKDALLELEKFYVDGTQPGVAYARACQLMEHPNSFPDLTAPGTFIDIMPGERAAKLDRLDLHFTDHLENKTPFVVYASLIPQQREIYALAEKIGLRVGYISGAANARERSCIDKAFCAGELDGIVCSDQIADVGFNWQDCGAQEVCHVIFASLGVMDGTYVQALRRAVRRKRKSALRVTVLAYRDSMDIRKMQIIENKSRDANRVDPTREIISLLSSNR